jgi:hypothetical protein
VDLPLLGEAVKGIVICPGAIAAGVPRIGASGLVAELNPNDFEEPDPNVPSNGIAVKQT